MPELIQRKGQVRRYKPGGRKIEGTRTRLARAESRTLLKSRRLAPAKRVPQRRSGYVRTAGWQAQRARGVIQITRRKGETDKDWIARRDAELAAAQDRARYGRGVRTRRLGAGRTRGRGSDA